MTSSNALSNSAHSSYPIPTHLKSGAFRDILIISSSVAERKTEPDVAKSQFLSNLIHNTLVMASIDSPAHSRELSDTEVRSTQQQPIDLTTDPDPRVITSLQILRRVDHSKIETQINQSQADRINMVTHLPRDVHSLQSPMGFHSQKTSRHQFPGALMTFSGPQDQATFASDISPHSHQSTDDDSADVTWPQTPARSAITSQTAETSMHVRSPEVLLDSASNEDVVTQQLSQDSASMHLFQPGGPFPSSVSAQPFQNYQLVSTLMSASHNQSQIESQEMPERNNRHLYHMLMDISHPIQSQIGSHQAKDAPKPDMPQIQSNMYSFEPQIGSYRSLQACNRQLPQMSIDNSRGQHDIDHQESHNRQMLQFSMKMPHLQSQLGFQEIRNAHDRQLARIPANASHFQSHIEIPQVLEAPIREVDQVSINTPLNDAVTSLQRNRDIYNHELNHAPIGVRRPRDRMEPPRTQEALNRQMALFATGNMHSDWQNGLQAGSRPAFWDQCRQNFGISQHVQPEPSARNMPSDFCTGTTLFPQLHLGPDGHFRPQQFGALQEWPSSYHEGARVGPFLSPSFPSTTDMPSQVGLRTNAQRAAYQSIQNQGQLNQPPVLLAPMPPAPMPVSRTGPAAIHVLPPALKPSGFLSKPRISSEVLHKEASDGPHATQQPPIGTPRASGPKLITAALERTTGQGQPTDKEPTPPSLSYYPGSDVMYPYAKEDPSESLRLLTAHGLPSIDKLLDKDIVPFMKGDEKNGAVDWGVIRIGNVSISLHYLNHLLIRFSFHIFLTSLLFCQSGPIILQLSIYNR